MIETLKNMEIAYRAALEAGAAILEVYESSDFDVEQKEDKSPLTLADRRAHDVIVQALEKTGIPILSEEGADIPVAERRSWGSYWLVDPLDGTKEFIKRNGEFTVNIALMAPATSSAEGGGDEPVTVGSPGFEPVAGVLYVPVKDIAYVGMQGHGAWKISGAAAAAGTTSTPSLDKAMAAGQKLPVQDPMDRPFTAVLSRSHNSPETEEYVAGLEKQFGPAERVSSGSSIKLCLVAEGTADVYPRFAPTMEWDTAAGDAVCRAADCRVSQEDGLTPLRYNKEVLLNPWFLVQGPRLTRQNPL